MRNRLFLLLLAGMFVCAGPIWWASSPPFWAWRARAALRHGRWDSALDYTRRLLARRSEDGYARLLMAQALSGIGDLEAALVELRAVRGEDTWAMQSARREGEILLLLDRASEAEAAFNQCLQRAPETSEESIVSRMLLVKIYRWEGRQIEAQAILERMYRISDDSHDSATRIMALVHMFLVDYGEYEPTEAAKTLCRFVANDPEDVPARVALARLEYPNGNLEAAATELEAYLQAAPDNIECREALLHHGLNIAGAEPESLEPVLDDWPMERRGFPFLHLLGELRFRQGRFEQAAEAFAQALELRPDHVGTHHKYGMTLARLGQEQTSQVHFRRSAELTKLLDYPAVKQLFESMPPWWQAGTANPRDAQAFRKVGSFYEAIDRVEMARRWYREADAVESGKVPVQGPGRRP